ncbi:YbaK / prolyl-tRNA synthetases associated domain protein [Streptomyces sp. ADI96-02]|uniref:aminoacyl-tRNA deacylase n=1 Tax=Streptomyces sp. ADI96-02 TaxID=1522760 RepID=UPI000FA4147C|nr:YbaK/EbsC family protein [Streptomyces sp. ADI96-02]RPK56815.1 YbaK / prolyl-tRNA synthetases associated domain protein [Streptomyces sp. ADI96-02]
MSTPEAPWRAVLDADGCAYTVHEHAAAHSVAERQALPFPWTRAVKTLAFTTPDTPLLLVALRAADGVDFARVAAAAGTSRSRLRPADGGLLAAEGLVPGGIPPVSHRPGVPCLIDTAVVEPARPVYCGGGSAGRTLHLDSAVLARLPRARVATVSR